MKILNRKEQVWKPSTRQLLLTIIAVWNIAGSIMSPAKEMFHNVIHRDSTYYRLSSDGYVYHAKMLTLRLKSNAPKTEIDKFMQAILPKDATYKVNVLKNKELEIRASKETSANIKELTPARKQSQTIMSRGLKAQEELERTYIIRFESNDDIMMSPELLQKTKKVCSAIEWCEPYYVQKVTGSFIPNDSLVSDQTLIKTIALDSAWDVYKGDTSIVIGISDSGILQNHEDYQGTIDTNTAEIPNNGIDDDANGYVDDYRGVNFASSDDTTNPSDTFNKVEGHGTGTAGIACAVVNNKKGIAGVGYNTRFFPMKTMPDNFPGILYGYQSILYAAENGMSVINLSWGGGPYSCIQQSIIDYAISKDLAIVAAAGNTGNSSLFYPAGYNGVLGVGVTEPNDTIAAISAFGSHVDILAPGNRTRTTSNNGDYGNFCCTSGAAPIISAIVALVRGKYPALTAQEALEHVRLSTDNIESLNTHQNKFAKMVTGRVNAYKALTRNPFALPSIRPEEWTVYPLDGTIPNTERRAKVGDTLQVKVKLDNIMGNGYNIRCHITTSEDTTSSVEILDSLQVINEIQRRSQAIVQCKVKIIGDGTKPLFLRFDIDGQGEDNQKYTDFFLLPLTPIVDYTTWKNASIEYTTADNGRIGFSSPATGTGGRGYSFRDECNILFEGGIIVTGTVVENVVSNVRASGSRYNNDFRIVLPYGKEPNIRQHIINDDNAPDSTKIGVTIRQELLESFRPDDPIVRIKNTIVNTSGRTIDTLRFGYFMDIDIGSFADSNTVRHFPEAVLQTYPGKADALIIERTNTDIHFAMMCYTDNVNAQPQVAGLDNLTTYLGRGFSDSLKRVTLSNGNSYFWKGRGDVSAVAGMAFLPTLAPGDSVECVSVFGADSTRRALTARLQNILDSRVSSLSYQNQTTHRNNESIIQLLPQPATETITLKIGSTTIHDDDRVTRFRTVNQCVVYSLFGNDVLRFPVTYSNLLEGVDIPCMSLSNGLYRVALHSASTIIESIPCLILR